MADDEVLPGAVEVSGGPSQGRLDPLEVAAEQLNGVDVRRCVAAGGALDPFRGETSRKHEIPRSPYRPAGSPILAALADFDFEVVGSGQSPSGLGTS